MKKSQLRQIIREEISSILNEKDSLNEMPIYKVDDKEGFNTAYEKFKEKGISKSKALNTILDKLKNDGEVDTKKLAQSTNKDSASFNNPEIRKFINRKQDEEYLDKDGNELLDFSPYLSVSASRNIKPEKEKKPELDKEKPESTGRKGRPKSTSSSSVPAKSSISTSSLGGKKYYADKDEEFDNEKDPGAEELRKLARSGGVDQEYKSELYKQEKIKLVRKFAAQMREKGIIGADNKIKDRAQYDAEWAKAKPEIENKLKNYLD